MDDPPLLLSGRLVVVVEPGDVLVDVRVAVVGLEAGALDSGPVSVRAMFGSKMLASCRVEKIVLVLFLFEYGSSQRRGIHTVTSAYAQLGTEIWEGIGDGNLEQRQTKISLNPVHRDKKRKINHSRLNENSGAIFAPALPTLWFKK